MEGDASMIQAFLLPGGGCAESFKKFNGNNIHNTPLIKVGRDDALGFMSTILHHPVMSTTELSSCLLLPYEQALGSDDVEFIGDVVNLVGIKVSDQMNNNDFFRLIDIVNPTTKPGRITIIPRMGPYNVEVNYLILSALLDNPSS